MQKILIATDAWYPQINGVVRTLEKIKEYIPNAVFLTSDLFKTYRMPGYPEIRLSKVKNSFISAFLERHPDYFIHIATEGPIGIAVRRWCILNNKKFTTSYHTKFPEFLKAKYYVPLWITYSFLKRFHSKSSAVMVATDSLKADLESRGFVNLVKWTRGVDETIFNDKNSSKIPDRFLYVGRLSEEKNIEAFLQCVLPGQKVVVGEGPMFSYLRLKYPEVVFKGTLTGRELADEYRKAHVSVFPSKSDTFGLTIVESLACGTPVAAYPVTGPIDILTDKTGSISENLQEACLRARDLDPRDCCELSKQYKWEKAVELFIKNISVQ